MRAAAVGDHDELSDVAPVLRAIALDGGVNACHAVGWAGYRNVRIDGMVQKDHVPGLYREIQVGYGELRPALGFGSDILSAVIIGERAIRVHGGAGKRAGQRRRGSHGGGHVGDARQPRDMHREAGAGGEVDARGGIQGQNLAADGAGDDESRGVAGARVDLPIDVVAQAGRQRIVERHAGGSGGAFVCDRDGETDGGPRRDGGLIRCFRYIDVGQNQRSFGFDGDSGGGLVVARCVRRFFIPDGDCGCVHQVPRQHDRHFARRVAVQVVGDIARRVFVGGVGFSGSCVSGIARFSLQQEYDLVVGSRRGEAGV